MTSATRSTIASLLVGLSTIMLLFCLLVNYCATDVSSSVIAVSTANACPQFCECGLDKDGISSANCSRILPERISFSDVQSLTIVPPPSSVEMDEYSLLHYIPTVFPKLQYLYVSRCRLSHLSHSRFKQLSSLREINLSDNRLSEFSPHLFFSNHKLLYVNLQKNPSLRLKAGKPLLVSKTVIELDLSRCNLPEIPADTFSGLPNLRYLRLEYNRLTTLYSNSMPVAIRALTLAHNAVVNVPIEELLRLENLREIDLSGNPINCMCELMGFQNWISGKGVIFLNNVMCSTPSKYRGWKLLNVPQYDICEAILLKPSNSLPSSSTESSCADGGICDNSILPIGEDTAYNINSGGNSSSKKTVRGGVLLDEGPDAIFENDEMLPVSKKSNKRQNELADNSDEGSGRGPNSQEENSTDETVNNQSITNDEPNSSSTLVPSTETGQQASASESPLVQHTVNQLEANIPEDNISRVPLLESVISSSNSSSSSSSSSTTIADKESTSDKQIITTALAESDHKPINRSNGEQESHSSTNNTEPNSSVENRMKDDDKKLPDTSTVNPPTTDTNSNTPDEISLPNVPTELLNKFESPVNHDDGPNNDGVTGGKIIEPLMTDNNNNNNNTAVATNVTTITTATNAPDITLAVTDTTASVDVQPTLKETIANETTSAGVISSTTAGENGTVELQVVGQPRTGQPEQDGIFGYSPMYIIPCLLVIVFVLVCVGVYASQRRKTFRKNWSLDDNPAANNEGTELQDVSLLSDSARGNIVKRNNNHRNNNNGTANNSSSTSSKYPNETQSEQTVRLMSASDHTEEQPDGKPVTGALASCKDDDGNDEPKNKLALPTPPAAQISTGTTDEPTTSSERVQKLLPNGNQPSSPPKLEQPEVDNEIQFAKTRLINLPDSIPKTAILIDRNSTIDTNQK